MVYVLVGVACGVLVVLFLWWRRRRGAAGSSGPVSVVILRTRPAHLNADIVRARVRAAFDKTPEISVHDLPDGGGKAYSYMSDDLPPIAVVDCLKPYFPPEVGARVAATLEDQRARDAMTRHKAWISIDAFGLDGAPDELVDMINIILGKLAAEFVDSDALLFYLPHRERIALPTRENVERLRKAEFADVFADEALHQPMFNLEAGDKEIDAAMQTARARLPEFLNAFDSRGPACEPLFKAGFATSAGGKEYIWCSLRAVGDDGLTGTIENPPIDKGIPKKGSKVTVKIDDIADWAYADETGETQGAFVDRILMARKRG